MVCCISCNEMHNDLIVITIILQMCCAYVCIHIPICIKNNVTCSRESWLRMSKPIQQFSEKHVKHKSLTSAWFVSRILFLKIILVEFSLNCFKISLNNRKNIKENHKNIERWPHARTQKRAEKASTKLSPFVLVNLN